jgi:hypothetical protein
MFAQTLQVANEMSGGIDFEIAHLPDERPASSAPALVG